MKFRQRNLNNGYYWIFGASLDPEEKGGWVGPKLQDNYANPDESDQFTGFKDYDGKEIYERDKCRMIGMNPEILDVRFYNGCFSFYNEKINSYYTMFDFCGYHARAIGSLLCRIINNES